MQDDIALLKKRSLSGIIALVSRSFILQIIAFVATFILTILLTPSTFGIFFLVSAVISFLNYFSDVGLAAALIQKKDELTEDDLASTFTIQEILVGLLSLIVLVLSGWIAAFYNLDTSGIWLLRALAAAFFISSLKTIPSILMERKLEFHKLIIPQIIETLLFYVTAVYLAWIGWGITSFTIAVLVRAVAGLVVIWAIRPWRIKIGISIPVAKNLLRFGIPFQFNSFLALMKDDLLIIFLGKVLTLEQIGYIGWAKKWAEVPLRLIMDNVIRITFPAFSRLQHSKELLSKAIEKTLFGLSLSIFPLSVAMMFYMNPVVHLIPKYNKWEPALFSFMIFVATSALASLSTPLTNALNAIGRIKITLQLMIFWTVLTWALTLSFITLFGFNAVALALFVITWSIFLVVYIAKKFINFRFIHSIRGPLISACIQIMFYFVISASQMRNWIPVIGTSLIGVILYSAVLYWLERENINKLTRDFYGFKKT